MLENGQFKNGMTGNRDTMDTASTDIGVHLKNVAYISLLNFLIREEKKLMKTFSLWG